MAFQENFRPGWFHWWIILNLWRRNNTNFTWTFLEYLTEGKEYLQLNIVRPESSQYQQKKKDVMEKKTLTCSRTISCQNLFKVPSWNKIGISCFSFLKYKYPSIVTLVLFILLRKYEEIIVVLEFFKLNYYWQLLLNFYYGIIGIK